MSVQANWQLRAGPKGDGGFLLLRRRKHNDCAGTSWQDSDAPSDKETRRADPPDFLDGHSNAAC